MVFNKSFVAAVFALLALPVAGTQAADKPTLTVYTYQSFASDYGPGPGLKQGFEAECNCTLAFVPVDSAIGALRRIQLEGQTSPADVLVGLDTSISGEARATGLFTPSGLDLSGLDLPQKWTDDIFVPFDWGYFAFVYDTSKVKNPPKSFEELIAEPASFKIALEDPRSDTPGLGLLLWIEAASLVKIGTTAAQKRLFFNLRKVKGQIAALDDGSLHPDQIKQIATTLQVSEDDVVSMNQRLGGDASLNAPMRADEGTSEWQDWLVDDTPDQETSLGESEEYKERMGLLANAMGDLNAREKAIFQARRLQENPATLEELAQEYNVSRERIRQIEVRAFEKVQDKVQQQARDRAREREAATL